MEYQEITFRTYALDVALANIEAQIIPWFVLGMLLEYVEKLQDAYESVKYNCQIWEKMYLASDHNNTMLLDKNLELVAKIKALESTITKI